MAKNLLNTITVTLGDLIGNGKIYRVPNFQRDYSWTQENWEDLWIDIKSIQEDDRVHYLGSIVLQNDGEKKFIIIDGQQRMATLSIIVIASIKIFDELIIAGNESDKNKERREIIMRKYLGDKDPTSLKYSSKLFLNENNDNFYQTNLLQQNFPLNKSKLNDSDKLMYEAFEYFYKQMKEDKSISATGEFVSLFIDKTISDKLMFIQVVVEDALSAYTVFETLNARGLELTATDLLKNYLFSLVKSDADIQCLKSQWQNICKIVGIRYFPQFLRYYLNSRQKLVRKESLFKEMRTQINNSRQVFDLLNKLDDSAVIYSALFDYEDELWKNNRNVQKLIKEINLFHVTQHIPLLICAYFKFDQNEFNRLCRFVLAVTFRYSVIGGLNPNRLENVYNTIAVKIFSDEITNANGTIADFNEVYLSDENFVNYFSTKIFNTSNTKIKKVVRYILFSIENQAYKKDYPSDTSEATIEHILPENLSDSWVGAFDRENHETHLYRLGNLTLLEEKYNIRESADKSFIEKKNVYKQSQYGITSDLIKKEEWTKDEIRSRQRDMARIASTIWKI